MNDFCAAVNVSDSPCGLFNSPIPYYWFPINEIAFWGYEPFYATANVIDYYQNSVGKLPKPFLLHCHAGANRSPSIAYAIYLADLEVGIKHTFINARNWDRYMKIIKETFEDNIKKGHIPTDIIKFLVKRHEYPQFSIMSLLNKVSGSEVINNLLPQYYKDLTKTQKEYDKGIITV